MRTIETTLYQYDELPKEAQVKAVEHYIDINTDHEWWDFLYDDLERIGVKVTGFDERRAAVELTMPALNVAAAITDEFGDTAEIYQTALNFKNDWVDLHHTSADADTQDNDGFMDDIDVSDDEEELETEFINALARDIRVMLNQEYDYLTSEESIVETLMANEYEFTKDGIIY
jgi:hypothetical protein